MNELKIESKVINRGGSVAELVLSRLPDLMKHNGPLLPVKVGDFPTVNLPTQWPADWPACPSGYNPEEWRRSLENKEYYDLAQIEDDNKRPWHQYPRHNYQYSELVFCTPEMMDVILNYMPINRPLMKQHNESLARDFENETWLQTHESLAINTLGMLQDGQHRANAIKKANKGWPLYVTWNVPPEGIYVVDSGEKRKVNQKLHLLFPDQNINTKTASLCRGMMTGMNPGKTKYTETEIAQFAIKHNDVLIWVMKNVRGYRKEVQSVIGKALLWWGEEIVAPFVKRFIEVQFAGSGDPAKALYKWITEKTKESRRNGYTSPAIFYRKAVAAISAHAEGRTMIALHQQHKDIFEWLPGYEVPENAPCGGKIFKSL